ncbi:MAG: 7-carboxy-7-deazaguanine synthase QueE [Chitinophagales bacterium]
MNNVTKKNNTMALPLMEQFYTIQGEGVFQGRAAYFIRLAGCTVGCHWCDVKESWDAKAHAKANIDDIVAQAAQFPSRIAVVTGGEPLIYNLKQLCEALQKAGFRTHLETSGAYALSGKWDWICISPKKFKFPLAEVLEEANELKVVIFNKHDFKWAEQHAVLVNDNCQLLLQPEWSKVDTMLPLIIEYVKKNPKWRVSLQAHKYMNVP